MEPLGFHRHDHAHCIRSAVDAADAHCHQKGLQLTPVRKRVLEMLLAEHRAMGAYDILDLLRKEGFSAQPPVAYRALDFLVSQGFAHRVERLNAFVACAHPGENHAAAFLICRVCKAVAEADLPQEALSHAAEAAGFDMEGAVVEAEGLCPACKVAAE